MKPTLFAFIFAALLCNLASADEFYVKIDGAKQGLFKGESPRANQPNSFQGLSIAAEVSSPRDAATGQSAGQVLYRPLVITKSIGASSPQLFQALTTNENLKTVTIEFLRPDANGASNVYYLIRLNNAAVAGLKQFTQEENNQTRELEQITLTYQSIEEQLSADEQKSQPQQQQPSEQQQPAAPPIRKDLRDLPIRRLPGRIR